MAHCVVVPRNALLRELRIVLLRLCYSALWGTTRPCAGRAHHLQAEVSINTYYRADAQRIFLWRILANNLYKSDLLRNVLIGRPGTSRDVRIPQNVPFCKTGRPGTSRDVLRPAGCPDFSTARKNKNRFRRLAWCVRGVTVHNCQTSPFSTHTPLFSSSIFLVFVFISASVTFRFVY